MASIGTIAINTTYNIQGGKEPITPIVAGGITFAILTFVASAWRYDVVVALAYVMFLAALLKRGGPIIKGLQDLTGSGSKKSNRTTTRTK